MSRLRLIVIVALALMVVVGVRMAMPIKNRDVQLRKFRFEKLNDVNSLHLSAARKLGIGQPLKDRDAAKAEFGSLVHIESNDLYSVDRLTHSVPYVTRGTAQLLDTIGRRFQQALEDYGLNPYRVIVSSVLRTKEDVVKLQKSGNKNAVSNSAHCYATTIDITYARFDRVMFKRLRPCEEVDAEVLKLVLGEVLDELRHEGKCYVKYEKLQHCFHITSRM